MRNRNIVLKTAREKRNIKQSKMADLLGISKPYYWQIENGQRNFYYSTAVKIAKILKTKPDKLFYDYYDSDNK